MRVKLIQSEHMIDGYNDINHNFILTPFGVIEGLGWDPKPQSRLSFTAIETMSFAILADFFFDLDARLNETLEHLLSDGIFLKKLSKDVSWTCPHALCT